MTEARWPPIQIEVSNSVTAQGHKLLRLAALTVATAALAACGNQMDHGSAGGGSMGGMDMGSSAKSAKATLVPANATTGSGNVTVAVVKSQVHIDVRAQQLAGGERFTAHLHTGSCASIGDVIKTIGDLTTDASGAGTVHLEYGGSSIPTPAFVDVHAAGGSEGPAVCGDLLATG